MNYQNNYNKDQFKSQGVKDKEKTILILKKILSQPIAYRKEFAILMGSVSGGVILSQLFYWWSASKGESFYKTDKDIMEETGCSKWEVKMAKRNIKRLGIFKIEIKSINGFYRPTFYTLNLDRFIELLVNNSTHLPAEEEEFNCPDGRNSTIGESEFNHLTENYTENYRDLYNKPMEPKDTENKDSVEFSNKNSIHLKEESSNKNTTTENKDMEPKNHENTDQNEWEEIEKIIAYCKVCNKSFIPNEWAYNRPVCDQCGSMVSDIKKTTYKRRKLPPKPPLSQKQSKIKFICPICKRWYPSNLKVEISYGKFICIDCKKEKDEKLGIRREEKIEGITKEKVIETIRELKEGRAMFEPKERTTIEEEIARQERMLKKR